MNIMDSITTLIVEDEPMLAEILVDNIKQFPQFDVIGIADKLESARKHAQTVSTPADPAG
jgi:two-component system response regulator CitB